MSTSAPSLRVMARSALERARARAPGIPGTAPASMPIDTVEVAGGMVRLVDHATGQALGTAVNRAQAQRTRDFFR